MSDRYVSELLGSISLRRRGRLARLSGRPPAQTRGRCEPERKQDSDSLGALFRDFKDTLYPLFESDTLFLECVLYCF